MEEQEEYRDAFTLFDKNKGFFQTLFANLKYLDRRKNNWKRTGRINAIFRNHL